MSEWNRIEPPPQGVEVLLYFPPVEPRDGLKDGLPAMWRVGVLPYCGMARLPTHWQPLSEPPKQAEPRP